LYQIELYRGILFLLGLCLYNETKNIPWIISLKGGIARDQKTIQEHMKKDFFFWYVFLRVSLAVIGISLFFAI
jgi:hypothetical protein